MCLLITVLPAAVHQLTLTFTGPGEPLPRGVRPALVTLPPSHVNEVLACNFAVMQVRVCKRFFGDWVGARWRLKTPRLPHAWT